MEIEFKKPQLEDKEQIEKYFRMNNTRNCEYTFANIILWSPYYHVLYAVLHDMVVFKSEDEGVEVSFSFPMGKMENLKLVLDELLTWCEERNLEFYMHSVSPEQFAEIERIYPGRFEIEYDRDEADYVYEREKLANLSGKKYHGKKNHINKFLRLYPDWKYETLSEENRNECIDMAKEWCRVNGCDQDEEKAEEMCVTINSLKLYKELDLRGGLIRVEGRVVAFSVGEPIGTDTFVVHIEKALTEYEGAYTMINQQFVVHETEGFTYINREDDAGDEGLRQAKLSYRPVFMVDQGVVKQKKEGSL